MAALRVVVYTGGCLLLAVAALVASVVASWWLVAEACRALLWWAL